VGRRLRLYTLICICLKATEQYKGIRSRFFYGTVVSSHSYSRRKVSLYLKVSTGFLQEVIDELI